MNSRNFARNFRTHLTRVRDALEQLEGRLLPAMSFGPEILIDSGSFRAADVNGDALADLAGPLGGGKVGIRLNLGGATFGPLITVDTGLEDVTPPFTNAFGTTIAFGDVTGDGKPDLIATDSTNGQLAVLAGNGDGTFGSPTYYSDPGVTNPILADVNGDGKLDIVVSSQAGGDLFLNRGDGTFDLHAGITPFAPETFADFDGDGKLDLAGVGVDATGFARAGGLSRQWRRNFRSPGDHFHPGRHLWWAPGDYRSGKHRPRHGVDPAGHERRRQARPRRVRLFVRRERVAE